MTAMTSAGIFRCTEIPIHFFDQVIMTKYFFDCTLEKGTTEKEECERCQLYSLFDDKFYWRVEWLRQPPGTGTEALVIDFSSGTANETVLEKCNEMPSIEQEKLRCELGSFAYFIERAVSGYRSYISWISPELWQSNFPWHVPLS
jgi:hypothetical protein